MDGFAEGKFNTVEPQTRALGGNLRIVAKNGGLHTSFPVCVCNVSSQTGNYVRPLESFWAMLVGFGHPSFVPDTYALPHCIHL